MRLEGIFEDPKKKDIFKKIFYAGIAFFVLIDFVTPRHHVMFFWDRIPGFNAIYGFISCLIIIVVSKTLGKWWLQKKEDYYDTV